MRSIAASLAYVVAVLIAVGAAVLSSRAYADEVLPPAAAVTAQTSGAVAQRASADDLKREYLRCERAAAEGGLDLASAAACSLLYEALRERVFNGDFDALVAWWRESR
jgi:hypothetical protein